MRDPEASWSDLSSCESEPIDYIGALQSHAVGVIVSSQSRQIIAISDNAASLIGDQYKALISQPVFDLFTPEDRENFTFSQITRYKQIATLQNGLAVSITPRAVGSNTCLVLQPSISPFEISATLDKLLKIEEASALFLQGQNHDTLHNYVAEIVEILRNLTGFDRVMAYKFDADWCGQVIAEARAKHIKSSFLGLNFPSTDIPATARRLFQINRVRIIRDINAAPSGFICKDDHDPTDFDLSAVPERAVSPIHVEYLNNMGVNSTITAAIMVENRLWGILAFHHSQPSPVDDWMADTIRIMTTSVSNVIQTSVKMKAEKRKLLLTEISARLEQNVRKEFTKNEINGRLQPVFRELTRFFNCDSIAIELDDKLFSFGNLEKNDILTTINSLSEFARKHDTDTVITKSIWELELKCDLNLDPSKLAGIIFVEDKHQGFKAFLGKCSLIQAETWAGDPNKTQMQHGRLSPRRSFDKWQKSQLNRSSDLDILDKSFLSMIAMKLKTTCLDLFQQHSHEQKIASEARAAELEKVAFRDPLTNLMNRRYLEKFISDAHSEQEHIPYFVLKFDLDNFKKINDTLGHAAGDRVLRIFADLLRNNQFEQSVAVRLGGDEFLLLFEKKSDMQSITTLFRSMQQDFHLKIRANLPAVQTSFSMGVLSLTLNEHTLDDILLRGDLALYAAKDQGKNAMVHFNEDMITEYNKNEDLIKALNDAYTDNQFQVFFQHKVANDGHALGGAEALLRWDHPTYGLLLPKSFIKLADQTGILKKIFFQTLKVSLQYAKQLQATYGRVLKVSVNLTDKILLGTDFTEIVQRLPELPNFISLEIVETAVLDDTNSEIVQKILEVKSLGFTIELDDFGTGNTSILPLITVKPHTVKIDRRLVKDIEHNDKKYMLLNSIIEICAQQGCEVCIEGVENKLQANKIAQTPAKYLQGFYFSKPEMVPDISSLDPTWH